MQKETQTNSPLQEVASILANGIIRMRKKRNKVSHQSLTKYGAYENAK